MPDTFYSWFVVTELHVWMLSARVMAEGDDGRILRNGIVEALWCDVQLRTKKVGVSFLSFIVFIIIMVQNMKYSFEMAI